jgi:probable F420-dependent oxidoreductase
VDIGKRGIWFHTDGLSSEESLELVQKIELLGYGTFWFGEGFGRDPLVHASHLLSHTTRLIMATGIASIYSRDPVAMWAGANALAEQSGGRFILGLGVSLPQLIEPRGHQWGKPLTSMRNYLAKMKQIPYMSVLPAEPPPVVIAALGLKMLELAGQATAGAHPCNVTPEYTARARQLMGPDAWLCVGQKVILETQPQRAREIARSGIEVYLQSPFQRKNWKSMGMGDADCEGRGSDRLIDALVAWGNAETIEQRVQAHLDAGASHVCIEPMVAADSRLPDNELLEALAPVN